MKTRNKLTSIILGSLVLIAVGCAKNEEDKVIQSDLPETFRIDVPSAISQTSTQKNVSTEVFSGNEAYRHLNNFIYVGDASAEIVEDIIKAIRIYGLSKPMSFSFMSDADRQTKNVVVLDNSSYESSIWQHQFTITDAASESNADGGIGLQVFWNTNPTMGIALLRPHYWDKSDTSNLDSTLFRIDYSEAGDSIYDATMVVSIYKWDLNLNDRFHMDNMKMFVGKAGDRIDVFGNSNHPDAWLFLQEPKGFNWAFVASGSASKNIGVAEVGLPLSNLDESRREVLLGTYSLQNVFTSQIREYYYQTYKVYPDAAAVANYLTNTEAPGFFNSSGFVQGGTAPTNEYDALVSNIQGLVPYNPYYISNLTLEFKQ